MLGYNLRITSTRQLLCFLLPWQILLVLHVLNLRSLESEGLGAGTGVFESRIVEVQTVLVLLLGLVLDNLLP